MSYKYTGVCAKHPELGGKRRASNYECVGCIRDRQRRRYAATKPEREARAQAARVERAAARARQLEERKAASLLRSLIGRAAPIEHRRKKHQLAKKRRMQRAREERDFAYLAVRQLYRCPGPHASRSQLAALWASQRGLCGLTGAPIPDGIRPHLDHIVPVAAGGASTVDNLHFVHPMANHAKNAHSLEDFRAWLLAAADALRNKLALEALL